MLTRGNGGRLGTVAVFVFAAACTWTAGSAFAGRAVFVETFEDYYPAAGKGKWRQSGKQRGNLVEASRAAAQSGEKSVLLYDNDEKGATVLDARPEFPKSGALTGYLMLPSVCKGAKNSNGAYTCIQLFAGKGGPVIMISLDRRKKAAMVSSRMGGERTQVATLPDVVQDDTWAKWQITWGWDGKRSSGTCRVTVGDKETGPFAYDNGKPQMLRLVSGWSAAVNNGVYYDSIRIEAASKKATTARLTAATGSAGQSFAVKKVQTAFSDTFDKPDPNDPNVPLGWYNWQPVTDTGKMIYDKSYGRRDSSSVCLDNSQLGVWQKKLHVTPGAMYRFSGWIKVETLSPRATVTLAMQPKAVSKTTGKEIWVETQTVSNVVRLKPGYWQYLEVFWTCPVSAEYPEGKFILIDVEFIGKNLKGKAWCDDVALDRVVVERPFRDAFNDKETALKTWELTSWRGLEGQARVAYDPDGFADPGAIRADHIRGNPGFSAATVLARDRLGPQRQWTLLSHCRAVKDGKPLLGIQQLDEGGMVLLQRTGEARKGEGWLEQILTFSLLPKTRQVKLLLVNSATGSAVFDNVWLRPALESETIVSEKGYAIRAAVFPADVIAAIDETPPKITLPAGQTTAINLHLAGEDRPGDTTIVDVDMPDWLELRTAQMATYGTEPLSWEKLTAGEKSRAVYRFKDPYPWQRWMVQGNFNPYTGLFLVLRADAKPGMEGTIVIRTQLGKDKGQVRKLNAVVRDPIAPAPILKKFRVGIWGLSWIHVRDEAARKDLLKTYMDAGVRIGSMHQSHGFATGTFKELGFKPAKSIHDPSSPIPYKSLPADKRPAMAVLANGKNSTHYVALGLALNNPEVHNLYRTYLKRCIRPLPPFSPYIVLDAEFWGEGSTSRSCFHPGTIAAFRKHAGIPASTKLNSAIILKKHYQQWSDFRNWVTAELHGLTRRLMREIRPDLLLLAYDYPLAPGGKAPPFVTNSPMNTLLYDPHIDIHLVSTYNREGFLFLDTVDNTAHHLKKPVWAIPFLMKNMNDIHRTDYNYNQITSKELRFEIVGAAASGAKGLYGFPGTLMDADYLRAFREGVVAVAQYEGFYMEGQRADKEVVLIKPDRNVSHRVHALGDKRLLTLFNCGEKDLDIAFKYGGQRRTVSVKAQDFKQLELK